MNLCGYIEMLQKVIEECLYHVKVREDSMIRDFMGHRVLTGPGPGVFNKGWSVVAKSGTKSAATPCVTKRQQ